MGRHLLTQIHLVKESLATMLDELALYRQLLEGFRKELQELRSLTHRKTDELQEGIQQRVEDEVRRVTTREVDQVVSMHRRDDQVLSSRLEHLQTDISIIQEELQRLILQGGISV